MFERRWRVIWTDGRPLPKDPDLRWYGYSVGHWEDDSTFAEHIGTDERSWLDNAGNPHSGDLKVEEFTGSVAIDGAHGDARRSKAYTRPDAAEQDAMTFAPATST
jgi:hypothetical protein